jgi:hypothetical protein
MTGKFSREKVYYKNNSTKKTQKTAIAMPETEKTGGFAKD